MTSTGRRIRKGKRVRSTGATRVKNGRISHRVPKPFRKVGSGRRRKICRVPRGNHPSVPSPGRKSAPFSPGDGISFVPERIPSGARTPRTTPTDGPWRSGVPPGRGVSSWPRFRWWPSMPGAPKGPGRRPWGSASGPSGACGCSTSCCCCAAARSSRARPPPSWAGAKWRRGETVSDVGKSVLAWNEVVCLRSRQRTRYSVSQV